MTRSRSFFIATAAFAAAIPGVAQASCSGDACSAVTAAATWSASDKQVNAVLSNKDQAKKIRLKFCITVEGTCHNFELALSPHENTTKSVSMAMKLGPPPKFAVDVSSAEFAAVQAASQAPAAANAGQTGSQGSAAVNGIDTPYGRITYFAAQQSYVGPTLTKGVADLVKAKASYEKLAPRAIQLKDASEKIRSVKDIQVEIQKTVDANPTVQLEAGYAKEIERDIENLSETFQLIGELADGAARNLDLAENELKAVRFQGTADQLIKEAEAERQRLALVIKAVDVAHKVLGGEAASVAVQGASSAAEEGAVAIFTHSPELIQRAEELQAEAHRLVADNAEVRFKDAGDTLRKLQNHAAELKPKVAKYRADHEKAVKKAQGDFDKNNAKNKGSFNFDTINALIGEAKAVKGLAAETVQAANAAHEYMRGIRSAKKDWMADASADEKIVQQIFDTAEWVANRSDQTRQETETILARLQETYTKAMQTAEP